MLTSYLNSEWSITLNWVVFLTLWPPIGNLSTREEKKKKFGSYWPAGFAACKNRLSLLNFILWNGAVLLRLYICVVTLVGTLVRLCCRSTNWRKSGPNGSGWSRGSGGAPGCSPGSRREGCPPRRRPTGSLRPSRYSFCRQLVSCKSCHSLS